MVIRSDRMVSLIRVMQILDREDHQRLATMSGSIASAKTAEQAERHDLPIVVFRLAEESFGLRLHEVREIIMVGQITPVPRAPGFVEGVLNLRGEVMPVLDLRSRFGIGHTTVQVEEPLGDDDSGAPGCEHASACEITPR